MDSVLDYCSQVIKSVLLVTLCDLEKFAIRLF